MAQQIQASGRPRLTVAVGEVKDFTGKYSINEGNTITQGGSLMVYSALGKFGRAIRMVERFDTHVAEMELGYIDRRQLGDGRSHAVDAKGQKIVPWLPYFGGTILRSNYFIVGGITELNWNIQSGGAQVSYNTVGPSARVFTSSIGVDLRIVDTQSLAVVKTISLQKQVTGVEVGFNVFRFFGSALWDVNIGNKSQEPIHLGVRATLEEGVLKLLSSVSGVPYKACMDGLSYRIPTDPEPEEAPLPIAAASQASEPGAAVNVGTVATAVPIQGAARTPSPQLENGSGSPEGARFTIAFSFGSASVDGGMLATIDRIALAAPKVVVQLSIHVPATENMDPMKRADLTKQRIAAVAAALAARGVPANKMMLAWVPPSTATGVQLAGSGQQVIARLNIGGK